MANAAKTGGVKKVGGAAGASGKPEGTTKPKKEKKVRTVFDLKSVPAEEKNEDGELVVSKPTGFDFSLHKPLKKSAFQNSFDADLHRADMIDYRAARMKAVATKIRDKAEKMSKLGDEKTAKAFKKANKIAAQMAALKAQLAAAGLNINDIMATAEKEAAEAAPATPAAPAAPATK